MKRPQSDFYLSLGLIVALICMPSACVRGQTQPSATQLTITQPINTSIAPEYGNYRLAKGRDPGLPPPPLPCIPTALRALNLPVYCLGGNYFLIDDSTVDYAAIDEAALGDTMFSAASNESLLSYPPGSLWLALAMTNEAAYGNMAAITLHGTTNAAWYEILSKRSLLDPESWSEGSLQGFNTRLPRRPA